MNDSFIQLVIIGIVVIIFVLVAVLAYMYIKEKLNQKEDTETEEKVSEQEEAKGKKSIFKFMEFDTIEDNMIVQDNGKRYLMVIECKGINYDLLSAVERTSIEQGFIGFLNSLKFEIQLYVQTKKVNLTRSLMTYNERLKAIELDLQEEELKYENMRRNSMYSSDDIMKELKEVIKKRNLYEYGRDVIANTEQMSENKDLTTKQYYIVVPYYTEEITSVGDYDKREIGSMAFSELYTRAQSLVNTLTECDVRGKILNSQELVELLFIAYNREQHDIYDFEEYINRSGFNSFYSTSENVLEKRMNVINEEIVQKANEKALDAYRKASTKERLMRKEIEEMEKNMDEYVNAVAEEVLDSEVNNLGERLVNSAKKELHESNKKTKKIKKTEENENQNSEKEIRTKPKTKRKLADEEKEKEVESKPKVKRKLTEEERQRRIALLRKKRKLQEKKNSDSEQ